MATISGRRWLRGMLAVVSIAAFSSGAVHAHEGHDHGAEHAADESAALAPRLALSSARVELVVVREAADRLRIYVDDYDTNAPLAALRVQVRAGTHLLPAQELEPGTYGVVIESLSSASAQAISVLLQGTDWQETLDGVLPAAAVVELEPPTTRVWLGLIVAVLVLLLVAGVAAWLRSRRAHAES